MTESRQELMEKYGISVEVTEKYTFQDFQYDNVEDALHYAQVAANKSATEKANAPKKSLFDMFRSFMPSGNA